MAALPQERMSGTHRAHSTDSGAKSNVLLHSLSDSLPALPGNKRIFSPREIEVRYFVPDDLAKQLTEGVPFLSIRQHYFSRSELKSVLKRFGVDEFVRDFDEFTSGRIRRSKDQNGVRKHELEFKGPKESAGGSRGSPISRLEFSIEISEDLFDALQPMATAGALKKRRYVIAGNIENRTGFSKATGHLDVTRRVGNKLEKLDTPFCTVDIEISSAIHLPALRAGRHSFTFLRECVEIARLDEKVRSALANSSIARHGLDDEQSDAIEAVKDEARRLSNLYRKLKG